MDSEMMSGYRLGGEASVHALVFGLKTTRDVQSLYTPFARGIQNSDFTILSEEFAQCSTSAKAYAAALTLRNWNGISQWLDALYQFVQKHSIYELSTFDDVDFTMQRIGRSDYKFWEIPLIEVTSDVTIKVRGFTLLEAIQSNLVTTPLEWFIMIMDIALFSFPLLSDVVACLRLEKVIGLYVRARLFQGLYDLQFLKGSNDLATAFIDLRSQLEPSHLSELETATSAVEMENMLHNTTVVGNDSPILFALTRSQVHTLFGKVSTQEYLHYVRSCEKSGILPVGYKYYQEIIHPISNTQSFNSFVDYSF